MILALGQKTPSAIAVDATDVYWANSGDWGASTPNGQVSKVSLAGGATLGTVNVLATGVTNPQALALSSANVFFANAATSGPGSLTVGSLPKAGGAVTPVATGVRAIGAVAVNSTHVYWTTSVDLSRAPVGGGSPEFIATVTGASNAPTGLALDATSVYWSSDALVQKTPLGGGATVPVASAQAPSRIVVHGARVFWTNGSVGTVMSASTDGTSTETVAGSQDTPVGIAVDSSGIYWTNQGSSGTVLMRALNGGQPAVLSSGNSAPSSIATDSNAIYWVNTSAGTIMKLAKP